MKIPMRAAFVGLALLCTIGAAMRALHHAGKARAARATLAALAGESATPTAGSRYGVRSRQDEEEKKRGPLVSGASSADVYAYHELKQTVGALTADPARQNRLLAAQRMRLALDYAPAFRRMELTSAQQESVLDCSLVRLVQKRDLLTASRALQLERRDPVVLRMETEIDRNYRAALREALGEGEALRFKTFEEGKTAAGIANGFAGRATLAQAPLTMGQVEQLTQVIQGATGRDGDGVLIQNDIDWVVVDAWVDGALTPQQTRLFKQAEAPIAGWGGARYLAEFNRSLSAAVRTDAAKAK